MQAFGYRQPLPLSDPNAIVAFEAPAPVPGPHDLLVRVAAVSVNPLGRRGLPADIAAAVHWLADDDAQWITGAVLRVDGGSTAGAPTLPLHWQGQTTTQRGAAQHATTRQGRPTDG